MRAGSKVEVLVEAIAVTGDGVAVEEDHEVRVPGMFPGERAVVRVEHVARQARRAHAKLVELVETAEVRRGPPCRHQGHCTGCPLMAASVAGQRAFKRQALVAQGFEVEEIEGGDELGYRWSSKRVAGGRPGALVLGSYRRGSHRLAKMDGCLVDHPDIAACGRRIAEEGSQLGIEPYDERTRRGDLRYVWLKTDGRGAVLVTLVTASRQSRVRELAERIDAAGVAWAVQAGEGNDLRGEAVEVLRGRDSLAVTLAGESVAIGPLAFLQPNPRVAERCYQRLCLPDGEPGALAFDLYAGAGVTTALLRRRFERVLACEAHGQSAAALGIAPETAEAFLGRMVAAGEAPELIIANPPRAGMGEAVCELLCRLAEGRALRELRVMSCNPASMRRDLARLERAFEPAGTWAFDTLPQTPHVELVVALTPRR